MEKSNKNVNADHFAQAKSLNLPISTKHSVEICNSLRYKRTDYAKQFLEEVIGLNRAVPFKRFNRDMGHKAGMAAGRFPQKAAQEFLSLVKSVEANAQFKGLNTSNLKITKILANKASVPATGGRHRSGTKRTNLEVEVKEVMTKDKRSNKDKKSEKKVEEKKVEEKKEELKPEVKLEVKDDNKESPQVEETKEETKETENVEQTEKVEEKEPVKEEQNEKQNEETSEESSTKPANVEEKK